MTQTVDFWSNLQLYVGNLQDVRTEVLTQTGEFLSNFQLYAGNLQVVRTEVLTSNRGVLVKLAAVCWQPTGRKDGSLDIKRGSFGQTCSCMLATYRT